MGERTTAHTAFTGNAEDNRPLGNTSRKYEDNIKMDVIEKEQYCVG
jgi:hypothetical protein